jgi:hypothetical protein
MCEITGLGFTLNLPLLSPRWCLPKGAKQRPETLVKGREAEGRGAKLVVLGRSVAAKLMLLPPLMQETTRMIWDGLMANRCVLLMAFRAVRCECMCLLTWVGMDQFLFKNVFLTNPFLAARGIELSRQIRCAIRDRQHMVYVR